MTKHYRDPVTGDVLTMGERVSWAIQSVIRRWYFLIFVTVITVIVWSTNNPAALLWWNLAASYLAIMIESIVGLSMYNQTRRDAVILRRIAETEATNKVQLDKIVTLEATNAEELTRIAVLEAKAEQQTALLIALHAKTGKDEA